MFIELILMMASSVWMTSTPEQEHRYFVIKLHDEVFRQGYRPDDPIATASLRWISNTDLCGAEANFLIVNQYQGVFTQCDSPPSIDPFEPEWGVLFEVDEAVYRCIERVPENFPDSSVEDCFPEGIPDQ